MLLIEAINDHDHWPRFIENESHREKESIKGPIDSLIDDSDAFVLVTYLTRGEPIQLFGDLTPIEYELERFVRRPGPVLWLVKDLPAGIKHEGGDQFVRLSTIFSKIDDSRRSRHAYQDPFTARNTLTMWLGGIRQQPRVPLPRAIIRCSTTDCIGQIHLITKFLVETKFNVDYIDQAAKSGKATIYISASQRAGKGSGQLDFDRVAEVDRFKNDLQNSLTRHMDAQGINGKATVEVDVDKDLYSEPRLSLKLRVMDVPGQLFSVTRIISDRKLNIERIDAQHAGPDHKNQLALTLLVSGDRLRQRDSALQMLRDLEVEIARLIGVRSLTASLQEEISESVIDCGNDFS